jgi:hypothetical protein
MNNVDALPIIIALYALVLGVIVAVRLNTKEKMSAGDCFSLFIGLMACSVPILLGFFWLGYAGAILGLGATLLILRRIVSRHPR